MKPIKRLGDLRIERANRSVECDLSEVPEDVWNKVIEGYEKQLPVPFFIQLKVRGATLTATFFSSEQSVDSITKAIDRRIESANTRTGRPN